MDLAHNTLLVTSMVAAPLLLIALITGLVIGMLQAATQINESTLSFIPKLLMLVLTLLVAGPWILRVLIEDAERQRAVLPHVAIDGSGCHLSGRRGVRPITFGEERQQGGLNKPAWLMHFEQDMTQVRIRIG